MRAFSILIFSLVPVYVFGASSTSEEISLIPMTLKMLAALGVVIGLFLLLYALVRKSRTWLPGGAAHNAIDVRAVRHLGPKRALYLVDVDGKRFFISAAGEQIRLLSDWDVDLHESGGCKEAKVGTCGTDGEVQSSFAALIQRQFKGKKGSEDQARSAPVTSTVDEDAGSQKQEDKSCTEV